MLKLTNIVKDYIAAGSTVHALRGVSVNFRDSEFVSILGPSGCGKTTLLNIIGGLDKYTSGDLVINGRSTSSFTDRDWDVYRNHRVGFVFQSYNLIPHQTVLGNVELALTIAGVGKAERRRRAAEALKKVGLGDQLDKKPNQLSGGQCQRVAIARALVNDPEILLADEPTGALDSVTSVQIMDLMKEIAGERLVIMVTHNPELAEKYSTRIIKLRDGEIVDDSNPFPDAEADIPDAQPQPKDREHAKSVMADAPDAQPQAKSKERAKMGLGAAFALSGRNLIAKKGRTIMVGIAGSIGIIGVAIVLAFSSGITGYINSMQNDMLSGYPLYVAESAIDYTSLLNLTMSTMESEEKDRDPGKVYVNSVVKTITELAGSMTTNEITDEYLGYIEDMPEGYAETIQYDYGIEFARNIYTEFDYGVTEGENGPLGEEDVREMSITGIRSVYTSVLENIDTYRGYSSMVTSVPAVEELPDSDDYILSQYDLVAGTYPEQTDKGALVLVLNSDGEVNDFTFAQMGYVSERQFLNYAYGLADETEYYDDSIPSFADGAYDYSLFVGEDSRTFTWYPNSVIYEYDPIGQGENKTDAWDYKVYKSEIDDFVGRAENGELDADEAAYADKIVAGMDDAVELRVACVLRLKDDVMYGSLSNGIYYMRALTDYVRGLESYEETRSHIVEKAEEAGRQDDGTIAADEAYVGNVTYSYDYYFDEKMNEGTDDEYIDFNTKYTEESSALGSSISVTDTASQMEIIQQIMQYISYDEDGNAVVDYEGLGQFMFRMLSSTTNRAVYLSSLGGDTMPTQITFWISSFDNKDLVTAYLDEWNEGKDETDQIQYTDTVGVLMTIVGTLITMITVALIVFTSISLVVSTVMIGIITFVSVVERIKEIGVIRAMGGRKRDVKNLFTAETAIIGLLAGIIGIVVTYILSLIANLIIGGFTGIYTIAALPPWQALIMVALSVVLTLISGLLPASKAAKQDPVVALRTE